MRKKHYFFIPLILLVSFGVSAEITSLFFDTPSMRAFVLFFLIFTHLVFLSGKLYCKLLKEFEP